MILSTEQAEAVQILAKANEPFILQTRNGTVEFAHSRAMRVRGQGFTQHFTSMAQFAATYNLKD